MWGMYRRTLYAENIADGYFLRARSATTTVEPDYARRRSRLMQTVDRDGPSNKCLWRIKDRRIRESQDHEHARIVCLPQRHLMRTVRWHQKGVFPGDNRHSARVFPSGWMVCSLHPRFLPQEHLRFEKDTFHRSHVLFHC